MVAIATVGHAYLKILPSLQGLGRHLRDQIREAETGAPAISLTAQVQTALLREQLRAAAREGDQTAIRLLAELDAVPAETKFQALIRRLSGRSVDVKVDTDRSTLSQLTGALGAVSGAVDRSALGFTRLTATVGAATLKYAVLAAGAASAIGALDAVAHAALTASGSLLLVPSAALALEAAIKTAKLGMQGFSDTLKETDPAKFAEDLAKLAPAAQQTALAVRALGPAWTELRLDVQNRLFAGMSTQVRDLGGVYLPVLRSGLDGIAAGLNDGAQGIGAFARETRTVADVRTILNSSAVSATYLAQAVQPVLQALRDIAAVGSEFLPGFARGIAQAATQFAAFIANARQTGQLREWISQGLSALGQLFTLLGNLIKIVTTVFGAANTGGASLLTTLVSLTGSLVAFLRSAEGLQALHQIFAGLGAVMAGLRPLLAELGPVLVNSLAPAIAQLGPMLGQALAALAPAIAPLGQIIAALAPVLGAVAQAFAAILVPAVQALAPVVQAVAPALALVAQVLGGALGQAIREVAPALQQLAQAAAPLIVQFGQFLADEFAALGPILKDLLTALTPIVTQIGGAFLQALSAVLPVLGQLAGVFTQLLLAVLQPLMPVLPVIVQLISQLAGIISQALSVAAPILAQVGGLLGQVLAQAIITLAPIIPPLADAFLTVLNALLPLLPPLLDLISTLLPPLTSLVVALAPVIVQIADTFATLVQVITPFVVLIAQAVIPVIRDLLTAVTEVFTGIGEIIGGVMRSIQGVIEIVLGIISGDWTQVWQGIKDFVGGIIGGILRGVADMIGGVIDFFLALPRRLWDAMGDAADWLVGIGHNIVVGLWNGLVRKWNEFVDFIKRLGRGLIDGLKSLFGISSPSRVFAGIGDQLGRGLAIGIDRSAPLSMRAAERLAAGITDSVQIPTVTLPVSPGGGGLATASALSGAAGPAVAGDGAGWDPAVIQAAVAGGVLAALDGARMQVDGTGVARLVNTVNTRNARR